MIGVDGGATATQCIVADERGFIQGRGEGGPSNHLQEPGGKERLKEALERSILPAVNDLKGEERPFIESMCLGMTGAAQRNYRKIVEGYVRQIIDCRFVNVYGDMKIALEGASVSGIGILIYAGTGTNTLGVNEQGKAVSVGGWGHIIDDEGGSYDIGRSALKAAFRAYDGRGEQTALAEKLKKHFNKDHLLGVREEVYRYGESERPAIGTLAPLVTQAADEGDAVAINILNQAGETLADLVIETIHQLDQKDADVTIYPAGGVFQAGDWIMTPFKETVKRFAPNATMQPPRFPPVVGATLIAMKQIHIEITEEVLANLEATLQELKAP
ncbi:MAG: BadF/BadG/BcrA/BcrD ATPase family protein [Candidatus Bipolaricaulia bacterium]